jgi:hypothetical protein
LGEGDVSEHHVGRHRGYVAEPRGLCQTESGPSQVLDELWTSKTAIQILAGSAVITAVINAIWFLVSSLLQRIQHWWNAKSTVYPVAFTRGMTKDRYEQIRGHLKEFSCLHVRFRTDQYLSALASDQEKYEGRLKNNVLPIELRFDGSGNALITLSLPHRHTVQVFCHGGP